MSASDRRSVARRAGDGAMVSARETYFFDFPDALSAARPEGAAANCSTRYAWAGAPFVWRPVRPISFVISPLRVLEEPDR